MATLTLHALTKHFGPVAAVDGIDLAVGNGEFLCMLGPSGCGKTTALRLIAGFETPTAGDIRIDDRSVTGSRANRRPTAMVFQQYTLWPHMTVFQNIAYGLRLRREARERIRQKVAEGLALVGLSGYDERYPAQLSGGQQQRVALARALVLEPKILLLDEPFSSLDAALRIRLREELLRIQRSLRITTIFVTHDQEEALSLADRIALMHAGRIEQLDTPSAMYDRPRTLFAAEFIGAMNLLPAAVADGQIRVGRQVLPQPVPLQARADITLAIRPEDFALLPTAADQDTAGVWRGRVEQTMDMGHYRKVLVMLPGLEEPLKVFVSKSLALQEDRELTLTPLRFLLYDGAVEPLEVTVPPSAAAAVQDRPS